MQQLRSDGAVSPSLLKRVTTQLGESVHLRSLVVDLALGTLQAQRLGKALDGWLYTPRMAEQATHPTIAAYHASVFSGTEHVLEICTGAGVDTQALARVTGHVTTFEADPLVAVVAQMNLAESGLPNVTIISAPWSAAASVPQTVDAVWADPSRRTTTGQRTRVATEYSPALEEIITWSTRRSEPVITGIKVGPGDSIPPSIDAACSSEYIGFGRECRERILWLNTAKPLRSVYLVDLHEVLHEGLHEGLHEDLLNDPHEVQRETFLIEPHNAAIAAGLVDVVFRNAGVVAVDPKIGYGVGGKQPPFSPWYEVFEIIKIDTGISERRIRERVVELGFNSRTEIKKRGWDKDPEELRRKIDFPKTEHPGVIIITRRGDQHLTVYARRSTSEERRGSP